MTNSFLKWRNNECAQCKNLQSSLKKCRENYSNALTEQKRRIEQLEIQLSSLQDTSLFNTRSESEYPLKRNNDTEKSFNTAKKLKNDKALNTAPIKSLQCNQYNFLRCEESVLTPQKLSNTLFVQGTTDTDFINELLDVPNVIITETLDVDTLKLQQLLPETKDSRQNSSKTGSDSLTIASPSLLSHPKPLITNHLSSSSTSDVHFSSENEDTHFEEVIDISNETGNLDHKHLTGFETDKDAIETGNKAKDSFSDIDETYLPLVSSTKENDQGFIEADDDITIIEEIPVPETDEPKDKVHVMLNSFGGCSFDKPPAKEEVKYKYKEECVRKKDERRKLPGHNCNQCKQYYDQLELTDSEKAKRMKKCSRHRALYSPPQTPEHYWELDFPNTAVCKERGYINETQKRELKTRRRNPLQFKQERDEKAF
ncbi:DNA endonuclease RBBP8-like isoform X2 [Centruroides sculpturatus]|uniref:DNA endonuclease RBBP8-like isoform X2 n=1 Tax=Centruroides sculpturatus TaxID=218467 RepID=UPI000C6CBAB8|nr:DNA endonuclease RBBP8-like isoform X2 [Centruroides sculpturatus]